MITVPATAAHRAFICNAWVESFRDAHAAGVIGDDRWRGVFWPEVERMMVRRDSVTLVGVDQGTRDTYYGFVCADPTDAYLFYVYVKEAYRRLGYARALLSAVGLDVARPFRYACRTRTAPRLERVWPLAQWDPVGVRYEKREAA